MAGCWKFNSLQTVELAEVKEVFGKGNKCLKMSREPLQDISNLNLRDSMTLGFEDEGQNLLQLIKHLQSQIKEMQEASDTKILKLQEASVASDAKILAMQSLQKVLDDRILELQEARDDLQPESFSQRILKLQEASVASDAKILAMQSLQKVSDDRILELQEARDDLQQRMGCIEQMQEAGLMPGPELLVSDLLAMALRKYKNLAANASDADNKFAKSHVTLNFFSGRGHSAGAFFKQFEDFVRPLRHDTGHALDLYEKPQLHYRKENRNEDLMYDQKKLTQQQLRLRLVRIGIVKDYLDQIANRRNTSRSVTDEFAMQCRKILPGTQAVCAWYKSEIQRLLNSVRK